MPPTTSLKTGVTKPPVGFDNGPSRIMVMARPRKEVRTALISSVFEALFPKRCICITCVVSAFV